MRTEYRLRLASGLILAIFVLTHLTNHALGIVSLDLAEGYGQFVHPIWHNPIGTIALYGALVGHFVLALLALYRRRTLRMPWWEALQLAFGLAFVPLVATHVAATRGAFEVIGVPSDYARTAYFIWSSGTETAKQLFLIFVVWSHAAIGIHYWLRLRRWYRQIQPGAVVAFALVPILGALGFIRSGIETDGYRSEQVANLVGTLEVSPEDYATWVSSTTFWILLVTGSGLAIVLLARGVRAYRRNRGAHFTIRHASGHEVRARVGQSILEALRTARIPHASVCGGRGRCTTCRVRIGVEGRGLPDPGPTEQAALTRIGAAPSVRLACQTRPQGDLSVTPLLPAQVGAEQANRAGGVAGTERTVTTMFTDLRGSTRLGQTKLPYDVLFILNQFFSEMASALAESEGRYAQFNGDGLMALFGERGTDPAAGATASLRGAVRMFQRIEALNERLANELSEPLRIGIGIHTGEAIVGTMGPPGSPIDSAIGDNINVAARLESLTKDLEAPLVISQDTARATGLDFAGLDLEGINQTTVEIRGRQGEFPVYAISDLKSLSALVGS